MIWWIVYCLSLLGIIFCSDNLKIGSDLTVITESQSGRFYWNTEHIPAIFGVR